MVETVSGQHAPEARRYSDAEKELNAYVRKHYPEWGCAEV
jgi:sulfate adenylyltransferase subunit 1